MDYEDSIMIVVLLKGGLGNQLFQYSIGRALAISNNSQLAFDVNYYSKYQDNSLVTIRNYKLEEFKLTKNIKIINIYGWQSNLISFLSFKPWKVIRENDLSYDKYLLYQRGNLILNGYWQHWRYFEHIRPLLLQEIKPKREISVLGKIWVDKINNSKRSVGLHVRRGDYVQNEDYLKLFGVLSYDYYRSALNLFEKDKYEVFVFSDDINWCKENFNKSDNFHFVDCKDDIEELMLMSQCSHNIIANSTFSWWGAWLNQNPDKIVVAPKRWFADPEWNRQIEGIVPDGWIRI